MSDSNDLQRILAEAESDLAAGDGDEQSVAASAPGERLLQMLYWHDAR